MDTLFASPYPVSDEHVAFFRVNGYVQFDDVLNAEELDLLRRGIDHALRERKGLVRDLAANGSEDDQKDRILQLLNLWELYPEIKAYVFGGRIARIATLPSCW